MNVQISLKSVVKWLMNGIVWILIAAILFGIASFAYSKYVIKPVYQSKVKFYADSAQSDSQQINYYIAVAPQYIQLLNVYEFYDKVSTQITLQESGKRISSSEIQSRVSFSNPEEGTGVFYAQVRCNDPHEAYLIASAIAALAPEYIKELKSGDMLGVASWPRESATRISPDVTRNTLFGILLGAILAAAVIVAKELFDNRLKSVDEITQIYELPILGTVPDFSALEKADKTADKTTEKKGGE